MMQPRIAHLLHHTPKTDGGYDYTLDLMRTLLGHAGLSLDDGLLIFWTTAEEVGKELLEWQPNLILLWEHHGHMLKAFSGGLKRSLDDWKGYVWKAEAVAPGVKCMATYAPSRVRMDFGLTGVSQFHLKRAGREGCTSELVVPTRRIDIGAPWHGYTAQDVVNGLGLLRAKKQILSHDIEGSAGMGPACYGFAYSAQDAFVVPIYDVDGCSIWSEEDEVAITEAAQALLEDPEVPKIVQNAGYEAFVEAWSVGTVIQGLKDDTMLKHWELYCELEKSLEFLASVYTNQPYWKLDHRDVEGRFVPFKDGRRATTEEWYVYNGTDCCVTYEVNEVMEGMLRPGQRAHYQFNVALLTPLAYMSLRGLRYDSKAAKARLAETKERIYELQDEINRAALCEGRPDLKQFYEAFRVLEGEGPAKEPNAVVQHLRSNVVSVEQVKAGVGDSRRLALLLPLLTSAFCCCERDRREEREVEETSWQPHRWNEKKWVKAGKRLTTREGFQAACVIEGEQEPPKPEEPETYWLKPIVKKVTRRVPVEVKTFEDVQRFALGSCKSECKRACKLANSAISAPNDFQAAQRGELSTLLNLHINASSTSQGGDAQWFLYDHLGLPKQYKMEGPRKTTSLTTDVEALLEMLLTTKHPMVEVMLELRRLSTWSTSLSAGVDDDGRMRNAYNVVGTNTGRIGSDTSYTGSGFSLHTVAKRDKDLFLADVGMELYSADLSGADSWTCAAQAARYGDPTMLDDLLSGLKPAKIVALMQLHGVGVNHKSREELALLSREVPDDGGLYPASKATSHGSNYGMKKSTMARNILRQSFKRTGVPIVVDTAQCERLQGYYFTRYPGVLRWQEDVKRQLLNGGVMHTHAGFQRKFFGRKKDGETLRAALSLEPQFNTNWAVKKMQLRMWSVPANRRSDGSLIVEPIHQIYDAAMFQAPAPLREWVKGKVREWFDNPFICGEVKVTIPYECGVGVDWKHLEAL